MKCEDCKWFQAHGMTRGWCQAPLPRWVGMPDGPQLALIDLKSDEDCDSYRDKPDTPDYIGAAILGGDPSL